MLERPPATTRKAWNKRDANAVVDGLRGARLRSGTPGLTVRKTHAGTEVDFLDPHRAQWVFVIQASRLPLQCKLAIKTPGGWVAGGNVLYLDPAPNYTAAHFERFVPEGGEVTETTLACRYEGGYVVPDYRFKLVEPPDPADCAECT